MEVITAPPAELVVSQAIRDTVGVPVYVRVPATLPDRFVTVVRAGGRDANLITDSALVIVQAWGSKSTNGDLDAERLALLARAVLKASQGKTFPAGKVRFWRDAGGPAFFPDPESGRPRYQFTGEVGLRAKVL